MINLTDDVIFLSSSEAAINESVWKWLRISAAEIDKLWGISYKSYNQITSTSPKNRAAVKKFLILHSGAAKANYDSGWVQAVWRTLLSKQNSTSLLNRDELAVLFRCDSDDTRIQDWTKQYDTPLKTGLRIVLLGLHLDEVLTLPAEFSPPHTHIDGKPIYYLYDALPPLLRTCIAVSAEPEYARNPTPLNANTARSIVGYGFSVCVALRLNYFDEASLKLVSSLPILRNNYGFVRHRSRKGDVPYAVFCTVHVPWTALLRIAVRIYGEPAQTFASRLEQYKTERHLQIMHDAFRQRLWDGFLEQGKAATTPLEATPDERQALLINRVASVCRTRFSPKSLQRSVAATGLEVAPELCKYWADLEIQYLNIKRYEQKKAPAPIQMFNVYLFFYLPLGRTLITGHESFWTIPETASHFTRAEYWSRLGTEPLNNVPLPFCEFLTRIHGRDENGRTAIYATWTFMRVFFEFLEKNSQSLPGCQGFLNPAIKGDVPGPKRLAGTTKVPFPRQYFGLFLEYTYALLNLAHRMNEEAVQRGNPIPSIWVGTTRYWVHPIGNSEKRGPVYEAANVFIQSIGGARVQLNGRDLPITHIPTVFQVRPAAYAAPDGSKRFGNLVFPLRLAMVIVALETGLRHAHIRWLSCDFDKFHEEGSEITKLWVRTDKVMNQGWTPRVSSRVIEVLRGVRRFREIIEDSGFSKEVYYGGNKASKFGKFKPLFSWNAKTGAPANEHVDDLIFRKLLLGFQVFVEENRLGDLNLVRLRPTGWRVGDATVKPGQSRPFVKRASRNFTELCIKSDITPHSTRASVVRNFLSYLPPEVVGKYITGQTARTVYYYYAEHEADSGKIGRAMRVAFQKARADNAFELDPQHTVVADAEDSALRRSFLRDRRQALLTQCCTVLEIEEQTHTGLEAILEQQELAFNKTHICPYGNTCPAPIVKMGLEKRCAICPYAVKALDHLPAITACIRGKMERLANVTGLLNHKAARYSETDLQIIYDERDRLAEDISGWAMAEHQLWSEYQRQQEEVESACCVESPLVSFEPDILRKRLRRGNFPSSDLEYVLSRLSEDSVFPIFTSEEMRTRFAMLRTKVLLLEGNELEVIAGTISNDPAAELRATMKGFMERFELSVEDVLAALTGPLQEVSETLGNSAAPLLRRLDR